MAISRREFIRSLAAFSAAALAGCVKPAEEAKPQAVPTAKSVIAEHPSQCPYCGAGCAGFFVEENGKLIAFKGDPLGWNRGVICVKGATAHEPVNAADRLTKPLIRDDPSLKGTFKGFREASWDEALNLAAKKFNEIRQQYGRNAIALQGSGQMTCEEQNLANKLFKGLIGSNSAEGNPRQCMTSAATGMLATFGSDWPPAPYKDKYELGENDLCVIIGSNMREGHPVKFWQLMDARNKNKFWVVIFDPRFTSTVQELKEQLPEKTIHVQQNQGSDPTIMNCIARIIHDRYPDKIAWNLIKEKSVGWEEYEKMIMQDKYKPENAAQRIGTTPEMLYRIAELWANAKNVQTYWTMGINQQTHGWNSVVSIISLHFMTGQVGRPGAVPYSITGQPNAMGLRLNGMLTGRLPGHAGFADPGVVERVAKAWNVDPAFLAETGKQPNAGMIVGMYERGIPDSERANKEGRIYAYYIAYTSAFMQPDVNRLMVPALKNNFVVVADSYKYSYNVMYADVVFPAATDGEKWGTKINSERRMHYLEKAANPPGEAWTDFQILCGLGRAMGFKEHFPDPKEYSKETCEKVWRELQAAVKGTEVDFSGIQGYDHLVNVAQSSGTRGIHIPAPTKEIADKGGITHRYLGQEDKFGWTYGPGGRPYKDFPTELKKLLPGVGPVGLHGKFQFTNKAEEKPMPRQPSAEYPFWFGTGIVYEHFHISKTVRGPTTRGLVPEAYIEMHPEDAARLGVKDGDLVKVYNDGGAVVAKASVGTGGRVPPARNYPKKGTVFMAWNFQTIPLLDQLDRATEASWKSVSFTTNELTPRDFDVVSGQSALKWGVCNVQKL